MQTIQTMQTLQTRSSRVVPHRCPETIVFTLTHNTSQTLRSYSTLCFLLQICLWLLSPIICKFCLKQWKCAKSLIKVLATQSLKEVRMKLNSKICRCIGKVCINSCPLYHSIPFKSLIECDFFVRYQHLCHLFVPFCPWIAYLSQRII